VYTGASTVDVTDSGFNNSTATNRGGALYCASSDNGSAATISGTTFENCASTRDNGYGGAIYSRNKSLTLNKSGNSQTTISGCTAKGYSGAVYMETSGSALNITDGTVISGCYANQGGAIYLPNGLILNLTGSPEFKDNGYMTQNGAVVNADKGACIYLEENSTLNLSGSPKFSKNNLYNIDSGIFHFHTVFNRRF
jgi:predicted outer membrane repeat protein